MKLLSKTNLFIIIFKKDRKTKEPPWIWVNCMGRCAQPGENCRHYFSLPRATDRKRGEVLSLRERDS